MRICNFYDQLLKLNNLIFNSICHSGRIYLVSASKLKRFLLNDILNCSLLLFLMSALTVATVLAQETPTVAQAGGDDFIYAKRLLTEGYHEVAIGQFRAYLAKYPESPQAPDALFAIGQAQVALKDFRAAAETLAQFEARYPTHQLVDQARNQLADSFISLRDYESAAGTFQRLAFFNPTSSLAPAAQYRAAELWIESGDHKKGRELLYKFMEDFPASDRRLSAHLLLVESFHKSGDTQRALEEAERLFRNFPTGELTPEAYFVKGRLQEEVGQFQLAEETYSKLTQISSDSAWVPRAQTRLAEFAVMRGEIDKASELFKNASSRLRSGAEKNSTLLRHTEILIDFQRYDAAQPVLAEFITASADSAQLLQYFFAQGLIYEQHHDFQKAVQAYERAIALHPEIENSFNQKNFSWRWPRQRSFLHAAACELNLDHPDRALAFCAAYRKEYRGASGQLADLVLWQEAEIRRQAHQDFSSAARLYQQIIDDIPASPMVDDAQFQLAATYEMMGEKQRAIREYRRLIEIYSASEHYLAAESRLRLLEEFSPRDGDDSFNAMTALMAKIAAGEFSGNVKLELGKLALQRRSFEEAISLFRETLAQQPDAEKTQAALFHLGKTYALMGERAALRQENEAHAFRDSAAIALAGALSGDGAEDAGVLLARVRFHSREKITTPEHLAQLDSALAQHPENQQLDNLRLWAAQARMSFAMSDSLQSSRIILTLQKLAALEKSPLHNEAVFSLARWQLQLRDTTAAMQTCGQLVTSARQDIFIPRAILLRADMLAGLRRYDAAADALKEFEQKYFYSAAVDSTRLRRTRLLMLAGRYQAAIEAMESSRAGLDFSEGRNGFTLERARAYTAAENYPLAIRAYLQFLHEQPQAPEAAKTLLAAAQLTAKVGARVLAKNYAEECIRRFSGNVEAVEAKYFLADLQFGDGQFEAARTLYNDVARESADNQKKQRAAKQSLLCVYKTPNGAVSEADLKAFQKSYPNDKEAMAELQYAAGEHALMNKDFETAVRFFNTLRKDYKDTPSGILGDYGLGKSLLMQNKAKDALEILTDVPRRYPDHPFLSTVYLGLGDFYQSQQQWDNAIPSFNKVIADSAFDSNYRLAVRSLINCYDRLGLWDRALGYMRGYLARFPDDEYAFLIKMQIGSFLINLMQYDDAIAHLRKLKPFADIQTEPEIQYYIGKSYMNAGRFELAIPEFLRVKYFSKPTKLPWDVTALYEAGICFMRLKDYEKAKNLFSRIMREQGAESNFGRFAKDKINELEHMTQEGKTKG